MSKKCIRCGAELPDHAKFCDKCGAAVPEQKQPLYCQKCGAKLEPGTRFCGSCGTPTGGSAGQEFQQFADSAKAAAQAGMDSAKKGAAKGMAYAAEKMAAAAEKMKDDAKGAATSEANKESTSEAEQPDMDGSPKKKNSVLKKVLIGAGVVVVIAVLYTVLFNGSGQQVRQAYMTQYDSSITVEDAFDRRFEDCKWSTESDGGATNVVFEGYDPNTLEDWSVTFKIRGEEFVVSEIEIDDMRTTDSTEIYYLMSYIYTGNLDELLGDAFLASIFF